MGKLIESGRVAETFDEWLLRDDVDRFAVMSRFFMEQGPVYETLDRITRRLDELDIPYAVVGGMALNAHGFQRATTDVDLLVNAEGLAAIHRELDGLGYVPPFAGSKHLKDAATGVRVEFVISGQFPGDGKPKPVAFPEPTDVAIRLRGRKVVDLPTLLDLKLSSGMTNPGRAKDIGDAQELIRVLKLPREFAAKLNPFVRAKYEELWDGLQLDSPI